MKTATLNAWTFLSYNIDIGEYFRSNIIFPYKKRLRNFWFSTKFLRKLKSEKF